MVVQLGKPLRQGESNSGYFSYKVNVFECVTSKKDFWQRKRLEKEITDSLAYFKLC